MLLTRETLLSGEVQRWIAQVEGSRALSPEELDRSRERVLTRHQPGKDLWLFAYGSLIWNPAFHFAERRVARLYGYHRRFCLWTSLGRGTPERPGLMLGLERGGSCAGIAYRIAAEAVETELNVIWRREMVTGAYAPSWVRTRIGGQLVNAVTFLINRRHERYAHRLGDDQVAAVVAVAEGRLGACRDYLFNTLQHLEELGIHDHGLVRVAQRVRVLQRTAATP
jgi:cation transport protein ChaC